MWLIESTPRALLGLVVLGAEMATLTAGTGPVLFQWKQVAQSPLTVQMVAGAVGSRSLTAQLIKQHECVGVG